MSQVTATVLERIQAQGFRGLEDAIYALLNYPLRLSPAICMVRAAVGTVLPSPTILWALVPYCRLLLARNDCETNMHESQTKSFEGLTAQLKSVRENLAVPIGLGLFSDSAQHSAFGCVLGYDIPPLHPPNQHKFGATWEPRLRGWFFGGLYRHRDPSLVHKHTRKLAFFHTGYINAGISVARMMRVLLAVIVLAVAAVAQEATPLTLVDAAKMTLANNPLHKAALADTRATSAGVREARAPLLPRIMIAENYTRGNDPVFVFGAKLRQQAFTVRDFALNSLNRPTPFDNYASRVSGQWNLFDSTQSWKALDRAKFMNVAAEQQLNHTDQELVFQTVQAFYGVLLAEKQVQVAEDAVKTVEAIEQQSRARVESGMAVSSDLLSAQVQYSARQQELIERRNQLALARTRLALAMGAPSDEVYQPREALEERAFPAAGVNQLEKTAMEKRPDLKRSEAERSAQQKSVSMAKAAFGPRLNAFGSWEEDSAAMGWTGANNWVAGVELQFDLFSGGAKRAQLAREKALQERANAGHAGFQDAVRLEVRQAYYQFDAAQQQVKVARSAIARADESLRINQNRYESGLSTVTDMLRVEEAAHRAKADYWQAVYRMNASYAGVELATGTLTLDSPAVTQ